VHGFGERCGTNAFTVAEARIPRLSLTATCPPFRLTGGAPDLESTMNRSLRHTSIAPAALAAAILTLIALAPSGARAAVQPDGAYPPTGSACVDINKVRMVMSSISRQPWLHAPEVVDVWWPGAQSHPSQVRNLSRDFVTDYFNSDMWNAVMPQYTTQLAPTDTRPVYRSTYDITLLTTSPSTTVADSSIKKELAAQVLAGRLPVKVLPDSATTGRLSNILYVVHTPPGVTVDGQGIGESCVAWLGYHNWGRAGAAPDCGEGPCPPDTRISFAYAMLPDFSQSACGTVGTGTWFDQYTEVLSHELVETITDPFLDGWVNTCGSGEEMADVCHTVNYNAPRREYSAGAPQCPSHWGIQTMFSNANNSCNVVGSTSDTTCSLLDVPAPDPTREAGIIAMGPNPTPGATRIDYALREPGPVRIAILDVAGRRVATLAEGPEPAGAHSVRWFGRRDDASLAAPGCYFVRLEAGGRRFTKTLVLSR
jgi:hypothetical protein